MLKMKQGNITANNLQNEVRVIFKLNLQFSMRKIYKTKLIKKNNNYNYDNNSY
jgi:hypothetical protein